jgi:hypothetical protein
MQKDPIFVNFYNFGQNFQNVSSSPKGENSANLVTLNVGGRTAFNYTGLTQGVKLAPGGERDLQG